MPTRTGWMMLRLKTSPRAMMLDLPFASTDVIKPTGVGYTGRRG
jgi:hypothetical protein